MRRAARIDRNQPEIVKALRQCGAHVTSLAAVGDGVPDLLVGFQGRTVLVEVKDGSRPPSERQLTDEQIEWHAAWSGGRCVVVGSVGEALAAIGVRA